MKVLVFAALLAVSGSAVATPIRLSSSITRVGGTGQLKRLIRRDLAPRDGWLPSPGTLGYRQVSQASLRNKLAAKARALGAGADGMTIYSKRIGAEKVFVFDVAVEGSRARPSSRVLRTVVDSTGRSLQ